MFSVLHCFGYIFFVVSKKYNSIGSIVYFTLTAVIVENINEVCEKCDVMGPSSYDVV